MAGTNALRGIATASHLLGVPVYESKFLPKGKMYFIEDKYVLFGTWELRQSVASIITSQRKRRGK